MRKKHTIQFLYPNFYKTTPNLETIKMQVLQTKPIIYNLIFIIGFYQIEFDLFDSIFVP